MGRDKLFDLSSRNVLITGGAGYLGSAMSDAVAAYGANLFILGKHFEKNKKKAENLQIQYSEQLIESVPFDIRDEQIIDKAMRYIVNKVGSIDVLVNNASYSCSRALHEYSSEEWAEGIEGTINNVFRVTRYALPYMMKQHNGNIINIASMYGMVAPNMEIYGDSGQNNPANYGAGKAAIIQFTKYLASVYAEHGIRANAVSPGPFPNPTVQKNKQFIEELRGENPMHRIGQPEDLQGIIIYLASDASRYTTGQNVAVDGGWTAW